MEHTDDDSNFLAEKGGKISDLEKHRARTLTGFSRSLNSMVSNYAARNLKCQSSEVMLARMSPEGDQRKVVHPSSCTSAKDISADMPFSRSVHSRFC